MSNVYNCPECGKIGSVLKSYRQRRPDGSRVVRTVFCCRRVTTKGIGFDGNEIDVPHHVWMIPLRILEKKPKTLRRSAYLYDRPYPKKTQAASVNIAETLARMAVLSSPGIAFPITRR